MCIIVVNTLITKLCALMTFGAFKKIRTLTLPILHLNILKQELIKSDFIYFYFGSLNSPLLNNPLIQHWLGVKGSARLDWVVD